MSDKTSRIEYTWRTRSQRFYAMTMVETVDWEGAETTLAVAPRELLKARKVVPGCDSPSCTLCDPLLAGI